MTAIAIPRREALRAVFTGRADVALPPRRQAPPGGWPWHCHKCGAVMLEEGGRLEHPEPWCTPRVPG